jgi:hypothetical protein
MTKMARRTKSLKADLAAIREDLTALQDSIGDLSGHSLSAGRRATRKLAQTAGGFGSEISSAVSDVGANPIAALRSGLDALGREFSRHPLRSVLATIGVGILIKAFRHR